jgi:hypothetical protein
MALTITERIRSQGGDRAVNGQYFEQTRSRFFQITATAGENETQILTHPSFPQPSSPHPSGAYLRVSDRRVTRMAPNYFEGEADYSAPSRPGKSPLEESPQIRFDAIPVEAEIDVDINGKPIWMIKIKEKFDPPPKETFYEPLIIVTRNVTSIDPVVIAQYRNATNSDTWYGQPPGTVRISRLVADLIADVDFSYFRVTGEFHIRGAAYNSTPERAHWLRLKAWGHKAVQKPSWANTDIIGKALDGLGEPVTRPVLHDINTGRALAEGADAQWYEFQTKKSLSFAQLGLI